MSGKKQNRTVIEVDKQLLNDIADLIESKSFVLLKNILAGIYPSDIARIINILDDDQGLELFKILDDETAPEVLLELNDHQRDYILNVLNPKQISGLVGEMYSDDAADIVSELDEGTAQNVLDLMEEQVSGRVKELLTYDENTAGGIMQMEFVDVKQSETIEEAVNKIKKEAAENEHLYQIWVTDEDKGLIGVVTPIDILLSADTPSAVIADIMNTEVISVDVDTDQQEVAKIIQKYDLVSLPVVDKNKRLVGKISVDDVIDIIEHEFSEGVAKIVGSAAGELESKSPIQIAWLRLPWVLITLVVELIAGLVINMYDDTLGKVILLASFMPIISAISGNTGLQAATTTVRALDTGHASLSRWRESMKRSFQISFLIGLACGTVIGIIAGYWYGRTAFGLVIGFSMFISVNISGMIGTSAPMVSKRLGFDPAITAGPFETAFQDVVGITIFLSLATFSLKWLL